VEKFTGHDAAGNMIELSVYGRDAADARAVAKLWRFCFYRDSGPPSSSIASSKSSMRPT
jgi:hypothetical protein